MGFWSIGWEGNANLRVGDRRCRPGGNGDFRSSRADLNRERYAAYLALEGRWVPPESGIDSVFVLLAGAAWLVAAAGRRWKT